MTEKRDAAIDDGSVWEVRYRVLGQSAVWPEYLVCELLTGPDKGDKVILAKESFGGRKATEGEPRKGLAKVVA